MTWAKFDDNFAEHPKVLALSHGAFRLHVSAIGYCARLLTDGYVPAGKVSQLMPDYKRAYLNEVVRAGLWVQSGQQYQIHDYLHWNRARADVVAERERKSKGGREGAQRRWSK